MVAAGEPGPVQEAVKIWSTILTQSAEKTANRKPPAGHGVKHRPDRIQIDVANSTVDRSASGRLRLTVRPAIIHGYEFKTTALVLTGCSRPFHVAFVPLFISRGRECVPLFGVAGLVNQLGSRDYARPRKLA